MSKSAVRVLASTLVAFAFALALSGSAKADSVNGCSISSIGLDEGGYGLRLTFVCDGNLYYTNPGGGCPTVSNEAARLWENMAMAAMLAGKKVNLYYAPLGACTVRTLGMLEVVK
jgi:hypothetical protein